MKIVNMHEAKTHLSRLVDKASKGTSFVIAKAGKPMVKVVPFDSPDTATVKRLGFLKGQMRVPADFDFMNAADIENIFVEQS
jgi:prevent-host-death family protein